MNYRDVVWIAAVAAWPLACAHPAEIVPPPAPEVVAKPVEKPMEKLAYPLAAASTQTDNYHGTNVADPYRWLESDSPQTQAWIEAENKLTFGYLRAIPQRPAIRKRLETVWNYQKVSAPHKEGGRWFWTHNDGLQNQAVLVWAATPDDPPTTLLDPNTLSADGTVALQVTSVSRDGKKLAYATAASGSDWLEAKVRDVETGKDATDVLKWLKFSALSWNAAGTGFYYSRYDAPTDAASLTAVNKFQKVYFHKLGDDQKKDVLVHEQKDQPDWGFGAEVTEDGKYLVINIWKGADSKNGVSFCDLSKKVCKIEPLISDFVHEYVFIGNDGTKFWFRTDDGAPRSRLIAIDVRKPARANWVELIKEGEQTLESATVVGERFVVGYLEDAHSDVRLHKLDGTFDKDLMLPLFVTFEGMNGKRGDMTAYFRYTGFFEPYCVDRYDFKAGERTEWFQPRAPQAKEDEFESKLVSFASKDGVAVHMFIAHRKGLALSGDNPTYLFGYGGFNINMTPFYSPAIRVWMEMGGVFAMPILRGGGEYGDDWHQDGMRDKKQNVFNDFIGAAQWLIANKYTSSKKLAIAGGSNGGLLVGACMTQRPELFAAAIPAVGVMDMLRFHKFTIGWAWVPEYGSSDVAKEFETLLKYSPLHNIHPGTNYPATLVTTADHDDRVVPGHSFKFAATLQHAQAGQAPVLIRIDVKAGHGAGKPTSKQIDEAADKWAFLVKQLGISVPDWH